MKRYCMKKQIVYCVNRLIHVRKFKFFYALFFAYSAFQFCADF